MNSRNVILVVVIAIIVASVIYLEGQKVAPPTTVQPEPPGAPQAQGEPITPPVPPTPDAQAKASKYSMAPELSGIVGYINAEEGLKIADFRGKVVLIDFWTYSCINCLRTLPFLKEWHRKYADEGLVIIGVHTPEFEFEKEYDNVKSFMMKNGIEYRVVQDNDYATWRAFKNRFWPRKYLIDADGFIRYDHIGEGAYDETEEKIQELLEEAGMTNMTRVPLAALEDLTPRIQLTPELYAGYEFALPRGQNVANSGGMVPEATIAYDLKGIIADDAILLNGSWKSNPDNLQAVRDGGIVALSYQAHDVNIVADSLNGPLTVVVTLDDKPIPQERAGTDIQSKDGTSYIVVDEPQLYNVVHGDYGRHTVRFFVPTDFTFHAF
ncbi:MAG: redoxin domain-containing protein, partial [Nanoarchaeota archaeon]